MKKVVSIDVELRDVKPFNVVVLIPSIKIWPFVG